MSTKKKLILSNGTTIAYRATEGKTPGVIFLGGFMSNMNGQKALAIEKYCKSKGHAFVRFDYRGHGDSSEDIKSFTIGTGITDALSVLDTLTRGPQILIGSSMGGWIMMQMAMLRPLRIFGLIGIAAAPDFTERLIWGKLSEEEKTNFQKLGILKLPSKYYDTSQIITFNLIKDGRNHLILDQPITINKPIRLLHGMQDLDVSWQYSIDIQKLSVFNDVLVILVKDGDHRLSRQADLKRLFIEIDLLCKKDNGPIVRY